MLEEQEISLPISWIADFSFCEWAGYAFFTGLENFERKNTVYQDSIGGHLSVHEQQSRYRASGVIQKTDVPVAHKEFGLSGRADMVEFHPDGQIIPIEYKRSIPDGCPRLHHRVQVCLQALCLEESYQKVIEKGMIYSIISHQRVEVPIDETLRSESLAILSRLKTKLATGNPNNFAKRSDTCCQQCTFYEICLPPIFFKDLKLGRHKDSEEF
jgi:CRISPR-associated exonuclease Cas4